MGSELLELRSEGVRDVQWLSSGSLLRYVLPASSLGSASSHV